MPTVALVLFDLVLVLAVSRGLRRGLGRLRQPPVIADILAGIVLGAMVLGALPGDPSAALFTPDARAVLEALGELAIVGYLFATAARFDHSALARERTAVAGVAVASFAVPWLAGAGLALIVHGAVAGDPPVLPFALFLGTALSVTAVPVLARIVEERDMQGRAPARIALAAAGAQELLVWPALAVAFAAGAGAANSAAPAVLASAVASLVFVVVLARLTGALVADARPLLAGPAVLVALAAAVTATEVAGLHVVVGALLFGVTVPARARDAALATLQMRPLRLAGATCLPLFFALPALRVDLWSVGADGLVLLAAVLGVAVATKLGAATVAARLAGLARTDAVTVGALMNARGLVELIVLAAGLERGLLDERLFSILVLMALATTFATGPLVTRLDRAGRHAKRTERELVAASAR